jgi:glutamine cyclotransferase
MKNKKTSNHLNSVFLALLVGGLIVFGNASHQPSWASDNSIPVYGFKVIRVFPHDPQAYTQGLAFYKGFFYEGTGLEGRSSLRKVELKTGKILKMHRLPDSWFGEGVTLWNDQLIQLTWKNRIGLIYDRKSFKLVKTFSYPTEGWGLTQDSKHLILSDGTDTLTFLDPRTLTEKKQIRVHDRGSPVRLLNELEYVRGEIWANVYQTDWIVRISPETGQVTGRIDLRGLLPEGDRKKGAEVLNGIAYDASKNRLFVTGKFWPKLFEIKLVRSDKRIKSPLGE